MEHLCTGDKKTLSDRNVVLRKHAENTRGRTCEQQNFRNNANKEDIYA